MKKLLPKIVIASLVFYFYVFFSFFQAYGQNRISQGSAAASVSARVGRFYLDLSGWISPYASVVLTSDGIFLRATVADSQGNFYISQVLIREGFSKFCLEAVDFKQIGDSYTCFNIPPAAGNVSMRDIFLPPTLGLARNEIGENEETTAFGYTMPGAKVKLYLSNGKIIESMADSTGYYEFKIKNLKAGKYELYARANFKDKESLAPTKTLQLRSLSWWEMLLAFLRSLWQKVVKFVTSVGLGPLWIAMPIIILIIILILKLWPEKFTFIYDSKLLAWLPRKKKKKLHHEWFMGY
jgi:hypothetical protein